MKVNYDFLEAWFLDRIAAGAAEEIGSADRYEDESGFLWFITKTSANEYELTTEANPFSFATGKTDENGKAVIFYN